MVQLKCPETGKPVDIGEVTRDTRDGGPFRGEADVYGARPVPCPHCGNDHPWSANRIGLALLALQGSPEASRVLVDSESATALS